MTKEFVSTIGTMGKNGTYIRVPSKHAKDFEEWLGADVKVSVEKI